jgi:hypothetical protein
MSIFPLILYIIQVQELGSRVYHRCIAYGSAFSLQKGVALDGRHILYTCTPNSYTVRNVNKLHLLELRFLCTSVGYWHVIPSLAY